MLNLNIILIIQTRSKSISALSQSVYGLTKTMRYHFTISTKITNLFLIATLLIFLSCSEKEDTLFHKVPASQSHIDFTNTITETKDLNILNFHYIYNGGGVGVADLNNDNLPDLVFSGNQVASKIYLNQGNLSFTDISEQANFNVEGWATGVSIVDINGDSWQDIYMSVGGFGCEGNCKNHFFIHQGLDENGIPSFKEMAATFGLSDGLYTQQAAFFDFDLDGDLDVYLLHNVIDDRDKNSPSPKRFINKKSIDQLFRNDENVFTDVSEEEGIIHRGYGLGITINDINLDGLPDIYIANDFLSDDLIYINKGNENGIHLGFDEVGQKALKHQSYNSMGVDIADINQDALPDILTLDMMPQYHERQKTMIGFMNYNKFLMALREGYAQQFVRNTLQVHNGTLKDDLLPFSEVGYLSGIYNTDWSWAPLMADFDNDGDRDIFVTNGYGKDITDLDFINYSNQLGGFGTAETRQQKLYELVQEMEEIKMPNFIFENKGKLQFDDQSNHWLKKENSISNGAVYTDLDNDGDLDLVVNNIDDKAFILENQLNKNQTNNYLKIKIKGNKKNPSGIGSKIHLYADGQTQFQYQSPVRGYLSSVDDVLHFGLNEVQNIDSLKVRWSNGSVQILKNISSNQILTLDINDAKTGQTVNEFAKTLFNEARSFLTEDHQENIYQDYDAQRLLLQQHSKQGPCFAVADVNNQVGDEIFIGGTKGNPSVLYIQSPDGKYNSIIIDEGAREDTDAAFFDFDNDNDLDLYIVSGGTEFITDAPEFQDRLFLNDGKGNFENRTDLLPKITASGSCVKPCDYDKDGDIDLFVGSRVIPRQYPQTPESFLLINHNGKFIEQTDKLSPDLKNIGMVTDAIWEDIDNDDYKDLIIVGEWMPISIFKNNKAGILYKQEKGNLEKTKGLWNCITSGDFDKDGDIDFLIGNQGKNSRLQASEKEPLVISTDDLDNNGSRDPIIGQYYANKAGERKLYPLHSRDDIFLQLVKLKNKYVKYAAFSRATFTDILEVLPNSNKQLEVNQLQSCYFKNNGDGTFEIEALPMEAQVAPIQCIIAEDFDKDGITDALLVGNDYTAEKNGGWHDAMNGLFLKGKADGQFEVIEAKDSGFLADGDARDLAILIDNKNKKSILVGQNSGPFKLFNF